MTLTLDGTIAPTRCCALLDLALARTSPTGGLTRSRTLSGREKLICNFKKAPRGDRSEYANVSYGECRFCPFCGARKGAA